MQQDIERVDFNEPISPSLERRVLTTMVSICESYLEQYPTTVQEDEKLMMDRSLFSLLGRQQRMAVKLRASEKRILLQTIKAVKDELEKLPKIIDAADAAFANTQASKAVGPIQAAGRSFDTRARKATVGNAKSAQDWVTMKALDDRRGTGAIRGSPSSPPPPPPPPPLPPKQGVGVQGVGGKKGEGVSTNTGAEAGAGAESAQRDYEAPTIAERRRRRRQ